LNLTVCRDGYSGHHCSNCAKNYFRFGQSCQLCPPMNIQWLPSFLFAVTIACFTAVGLHYSELFSTAFIISFKGLQLTGVLSIVSSTWPSPLKEMLGIVSLSNFGFAVLLPGCIAPSFSIWDEISIQASVPFILLLIKSVVDAKKNSSKLQVRAMALQAATHLLFIVNLLYTMICLAMFSPVLCLHRENETFFIAREPSISCFDASWANRLGSIVFLVILFAVLFPFGFLFVFVKKFEFFEKSGLFGLYSENYSYWELIQVPQRAVLTWLLLRIPSDYSSTVSYYYVVLWLFLVLCLENCAEPFLCNRFAMTSNLWNILVLILVLADAFLFKDASVSSSIKTMIGVSFFLIILTLIFRSFVSDLIWSKDHRVSRQVTIEQKDLVTLSTGNKIKVPAGRTGEIVTQIYMTLATKPNQFTPVEPVESLDNFK
jgi:hypothetical protein